MDSPLSIPIQLIYLPETTFTSASSPTQPNPTYPTPPALPRLDIDDMVLAQPEATDHKCDFDQFIVTGGSPLPAICGTNTGLHSKLNGCLSPLQLCKVADPPICTPTQAISLHSAAHPCMNRS